MNPTLEEYRQRLLDLVDDFENDLGIKLESLQINPEFVWSLSEYSKDVSGLPIFYGRKKRVEDGKIITEHYVDCEKVGEDYQNL